MYLESSQLPPSAASLTEPHAGPARVRILLADDHELVRAGMRALLSLHPEFEVVAEARDGREVLELLGRLAVDVVLCDLHMPHLDGIDCVERIGQRHPQVRVILLTMDDGATSVRLATSRGAAGYLVKHAATAELVQAVGTVVRGGRYLSPVLARRLLEADEPPPAKMLTERQIEVLKLIASGHSSREIGALLNLSSKTVDVHRAHVLERLGLRDVAGLTRYALKHRLVR